MEKELQTLDEGTKVETHIDSHKETLEKIPNWKIPGFNDIHGFCFKNSLPSTTD